MPAYGITKPARPKHILGKGCKVSSQNLKNSKVGVAKVSQGMAHVKAGIKRIGTNRVQKRLWKIWHSPLLRKSSLTGIIQKKT